MSRESATIPSSLGRRSTAGRAALTGLLLLVLAVLPLAAPALAQSAADASKRQDLTSAEEPSPQGDVLPGTRRALILCGHPGDPAHRAMYARSVQKLSEGLTQCCGFDAEQVWVRFGSQPQADDLPAIAGCRGLSTREAIEEDVAELGKQLDPQDALWVIVLGHAHFDGRHSHLNLPGPDIREDEFGRLFETIVAREQVFWITTPASGFFIKHLSAKGRIVISATEADQEVNETVLHVPLADVLSNPPDEDEYDEDGDGRISVLDLYLTVVRRVAMMYKTAENIPTEHAQLDDNGDGRSTELQIDYLPPDLGGRAKEGNVVELSPSRDGALAATVEIPVSRPEEPTETMPEEPFDQHSPSVDEPNSIERMQVIPEKE
ncbi:MAG: hypothetical protein V3R99_09685 [Thermoguttaceae bacterium]